MGITNPAEEYFKDGGWHWTGSQWVKGGLAFEYASQILGEAIDADAGVGNNFVAGAAVDPGEVWVITSMCIINTVSNMTGARLGVLVGAGHNWAAATGVLLGKVGFSWAGQLIMVAGDKPEAMCQGCTAGDDLYFYYFGYKMRLT